MADLIKYRRRCLTEGIYVYWWIPQNESVPDQCPHNTAHTLDPDDSWVVVETKSDTIPINSLGDVNVAQNVHTTGYKLTMQGFEITVPSGTSSTVTHDYKFRLDTNNGPLKTVSINSGGSGYSVDDVLTVTGGSGTGGTLTVTSVDAGAVTGVDITTQGDDYVVDTDGAATSGGSGSGATIDIDDIDIDTTIELYSGLGWLNDGANYGDTVDVEIYHPIAGTMWKFLKDFPVKPGHDIHLIEPDRKADVPAGLYIRVSYTPAAELTSDVKMGIVLGFYAGVMTKGIEVA